MLFYRKDFCEVAKVARLIAIDGNSLMHRAYYALPSMTSSDGTPTGAVYGFISMLLKLLDYAPEYVVVAFDMHGPTFRHDQYDQYKEGRRPTPDDLRTQFPMLKKLLGEMGITVCECERYEADDILGTFSRIANAGGVDALLVTGDRDALQLINDHTHVLMTKKGISDTVEYDEAVLMEQYGLEPGRMVDLKGLMGDSSDNLPGIPGVGEKTALKLLAKYGSLENTLANAENEKGALRQKLLDNAESARMSYALGTINTNAPISIGMADCRFEPAAMAGGISTMNTWELRSLIRRLPKGSAPAPKKESINVNTVEITDNVGLGMLIEVVSTADAVAIVPGERLGIAISETEQYEISLGATLFDQGLSADGVIIALKPVLENEHICKIVFDSKAMRHFLAGFGVQLKGRVFDAMIADYLLHAIHPADSFKVLCSERGMAEGGAALVRLRTVMRMEMEQKGMLALYDDVELPLTEVLFDMEQTGIAVDSDMLSTLSEKFALRIADIEQNIYTLAGEKFNILSTKQLGSILFDKLGLPPQKKTKSGYSTDSEVLEVLEDRHEIVPLVIEYRFLSKLKSTFLDGLVVLTRGGRIHTKFNQNVTATGRISSTEPNLQNIPVRTELGREIRRAFTASPGNVLVGADYSQIELRLLAHMSGDARLISAFNSGMDVHTSTAAEVFGVPVSDVTREQRSAAKAVNFGIVYGISDFGLAKNIGVSRREAGEFIQRYLARYSGVREYMSASVEKGRAAGYVSTLMGRRRELPEITSSNYNTRSFGERVAMNMPIQGTAADIIKVAMVRVHRALRDKGLRARLVLQIHDELIIDTPEAEAELVKELLADCMQNVMELKVPLTAEVSSGYSWFDTK